MIYLKVMEGCEMPDGINFKPSLKATGLLWQRLHASIEPAAAGYVV